jgi:hypothetical protein
VVKAIRISGFAILAILTIIRIFIVFYMMLTAAPVKPCGVNGVYAQLELLSRIYFSYGSQHFRQTFPTGRRRQ